MMMGHADYSKWPGERTKKQQYNKQEAVHARLKASHPAILLYYYTAHQCLLPRQ